MFRKMFVFAMLLSVLIAGGVQTAAAQTRDQDEPIVLPAFPASIRELPANHEDSTIVVKSRSLQSLDEVRRAIPYRNTYMTPPPPLQEYEREIDLIIITLVCVYDKKTGEWIYCDIYLG